MPGVLRRLTVRTLLLFSGAAAAWLLAGVLQSATAAAATVPAPLSAVPPVTPVSPVSPGSMPFTMPVSGRPDGPGAVASVVSDPFATLAPVLTAVLGATDGSLPSLPSVAPLPGLPPLLPPVIGGGISLPGVPLAGLVPGIGSDLVIDTSIRRPASASGEGPPADLETGATSDPAPTHPALARTVPVVATTPLTPIVPPASPPPAPAPTSSGTGGTSGPLRDTDVNRDGYRGSLIAIRAPPRDVRPPATGPADDPPFAPD